MVAYPLSLCYNEYTYIYSNLEMTIFTQTLYLVSSITAVA